VRHRIPAGRCDCGAPLPWSSHFCPNCGRPAGEQPVIVCAECGHPLPGDARFCASCGAAAGESGESTEEDALEEAGGETA
jgi:predicted amidophosphoribosyltransferase